MDTGQRPYKVGGLASEHMIAEVFSNTGRSRSDTYCMTHTPQALKVYACLNDSVPHVFPVPVLVRAASVPVPCVEGNVSTQKNPGSQWLINDAAPVPVLEHKDGRLVHLDRQVSTLRAAGMVHIGLLAS